MSLYESNPELQHCKRCGAPAPIHRDGPDGERWNVQFVNGKPLYSLCPACQTADENEEAANNAAIQQEHGMIPIQMFEGRLFDSATFRRLTTTETEDSLGLGPVDEYFADNPSMFYCAIPVMLKDRLIAVCFPYEPDTEGATVDMGMMRVRVMNSLTASGVYKTVICDFDPADFMGGEQVIFPDNGMKRVFDDICKNFIEKVVTQSIP